MSTKTDHQLFLVFLCLHSFRVYFQSAHTLCACTRVYLNAYFLLLHFSSFELKQSSLVFRIDTILINLICGKFPFYK